MGGQHSKHRNPALLLKRSKILKKAYPNTDEKNPLLKKQRKREESHSSLRSELARMASFPQRNPNPIIETDLSGCILYRNLAARRLLPGLKSKALNHPWMGYWKEISPNFGKNRAVSIVREVLAGGRTYNQMIYYLPDLQRVRIYGMDITWRKQAEKELHRLNRTLRAISNTNQLMARAKSEPGYLKNVCRIVARDCGHRLVWIGYAENDEEKTVRPVAHSGFDRGYVESLRITWADHVRGRGPTGTAIRTGKVCVCRNMLTDPDFTPWRASALERGYASSIVLPLRAGGKILGAINIYSKDPDPFSKDEVKFLKELAGDIAYGIIFLRLRAAHTKAEEALKISERRYRSLFEQMTEGFALHEIVCDANGEPKDYIFLDVNPTFEKLAGLKKGAVIGKCITQIFPGENPLWIKAYGEVALTGKPVRFEKYSPTLKRNYDVVAFRPAPNQFAVLFTDITGRKEQEKRKDEFISMASHELRTPLTSIKAYTQILKEKLADSQNGQSLPMIERMEDQVDKITNLVATMLDVTKIQSGKMSYQKDVFDFDRLVEETLSDVAAISGKVKVKTIGRAKKQVTADRFRIGQVLTNLLTNAIKYSPEGGRVVIKVTSTNKEVSVTVADSGIGIPRDKLQKVFDRYFQVNPGQVNRGSPGGLGLGLYISSEIIKYHGGGIWAESVVGKGSKFHFSLPVLQ